MDTINENAKSMDVESTIVYSKNKKAYKDVTCDTLFKTSELRDAFIHGAVVDIAKGTYGNESQLSLKPTSYTESFDTGKLWFAVPTFGIGKNKYQGAAYDKDAVSVEGENLTYTKRANNENLAISNSITFGQIVEQSMTVEFGIDSLLYSVLNSYEGMKTISFKCAVQGKVWDSSGGYDGKCPAFTVTCGSATKTIPASKYTSYENYNISLTVTDASVLQIDFPDDAPWFLNIDDVQVELGPEATQYEEYKEIREVKYVSAASAPDVDPT